ncbi:unnamed protein product [Allacma fusca]|uniref:Uncharacterized protein n=1 Tax=Allacma fusca TaxID=39272 RepID=A0A8J2PDF9_9HEXA|nr:unnamed protein product [Allacma fusca]
MFFKQNLTPTLPILGFFNKIWSVLGLIPYNWNQEKGEYSECGKIKYAYWVFSAVFLVGIQTLYVNFQFISFIQAMNANNLWGNVKSMGDFTVVTNIWLTYITFSLYNLNTVLHYSDLVKFYNEHIRYRKELRNTSVYLRNNLPIMYPLLLVVPLRFASLVSACISNPDSPIFVYSAFPSSWKTPIGHGIFVGMFIPFCATFWVTLQFNVTTITMHVATVGTGIKHCAESKSGNIFEDLKMYRKFVLLTRLFENASGKLSFVANLISIISICTVSAYGMIRFFGKIAPKLYVMFLSPVTCMNIYLIKVLLPSAMIRQNSTQFKRNMLESSRGSRDLKLVKAVMSSLPDLRVKVGNYFTINRTSYFEVLGLISVNTMTLLINL